MIAQGFPPLKSMGSIRNYKAGKEYLKYFEQVSVITPKDKNSWSKDESIDLSAFDVYEVGSGCLHTVLGKCPDSIKFNSKRRQGSWSIFVSKFEDKEKIGLNSLKDLPCNLPLTESTVPLTKSTVPLTQNHY